MKGFVEELRDLVEHWTRKTRFYGFYPYKTSDDGVGRPSLQAIGVVDGLPSELLPDQLYVDKAHGAPGATSKLAKDTIVLVGFKGGDPGSPFVAFYLPGQPLPLTVELDAQTSVTLDAPNVKLGKNATSVVALGVACNTNFNTLRTAINGLGGSVPPLPSVSATKTRAE